MSATFPGIDHDVAVTGALLHDIGKLEAYASDGLRIEMTDAGRLQGEIVLGYTRVRRAIETIEGFPAGRAEALLHIILSHHGTLEHGSPVVPCTREATLVHFVDNLGGRLGSFDRLEKELGDGERWSAYDRVLGCGAYFAGGPVPARCRRAARRRRVGHLTNRHTGRPAVAGVAPMKRSSILAGSLVRPAGDVQRDEGLTRIAGGLQDRVHLAGALQDPRHVLRPLLGAEPIGPALEQFREARDDGQRRAQVVHQRRQRVALAHASGTRSSAISPRSSASAIACTRLRACSLRIALRTWVRTVSTDTPS